MNHDARAAGAVGPGLSTARRAMLDRVLRGDLRPQDRDPVRPRPPGCVVPLSAEQEHVWLHASLAPDMPLYNEAITIHRSGACNPGVLQASLNEVIRRHEIWRTSFLMTTAGMTQRIENTVELHLPFSDLRSLPPQHREAAATAIAERQMRLSFDLTAAPLIRGHIVRMADDDHRLYLTLHHIIFDGVSIYRILIPTLASVYDELSANNSAKPVAVPAPLQYGDYAVWRARQLAGPEIDRQMLYWRLSLAGNIPALRLPLDHPPPAAPSFRGDMRIFKLDALLTASVKHLALRLGVTQYVVLLTCFQALLFRYSGQNDIVVGAVTDMRRKPALATLMGYFLNALAIRTRPRAETSFADYARQTSVVVLSALDACEVPFGRVVRELRAFSEAGEQDLFRVLFSIEPPAPEFPAGWDLTQMDIPVVASKFDLYFELDERPEGLLGRIMYATDLFKANTIVAMIEHWRMLLQSAVARPDTPLGALDLLTSAEIQQLTVWNATARPVPDGPVQALFEAQMRRTPDAVAIATEEGSCSYYALDQMANRIAAHLCHAGVGPDTLVAICVERSLVMVAAMLGCLKAGGAYLALAPDLPPARMASYLEESSPTLILTERDHPSLLDGCHIPSIYLDDFFIRPTPARSEAAAALHAGSLAYVLCTSGSTGRPKAVEISHGALINLLMAMQAEPGFTASDRLLAVTTVSFDIAQLEILLPLVSGGCVILPSTQVVRDPARLIALMQRMRPTVMQATPSYWRLLIESGWQGTQGLTIMAGGEAMPPDLGSLLLDRADAVWNMYGPTETTIWSTVFRLDGRARPVPIGRPIANTRTHVLDPSGRILPIGVAGRLYIGGAGLARGYRNQPELTRQLFREQAGVPGERLYDTGDLVRLRTDGGLEWLGRADSQIKVRGHRVEPAEIESALTAHPAVASAAVTARQDGLGDVVLIGYVVFHEGDTPTPTASALRAFLKPHLLDYMIPARYVVLAAMPLTANGKLDRAALPPPPIERIAAIKEPRNDTEHWLLRTFSTLFGCSVSGVDENFFDLGGHSLLAARLLVMVQEQFRRQLPLSAIFAAPTVALLADAILRSPAAQSLDAGTRALMLDFESLGEDCEFGLVQRHFGAEPLSLLRFTAIAPNCLLALLDCDFAGLADPGLLQVAEHGAAGEYVVYNSRFDVSYQTIAGNVHAAPEEQLASILAREAVKLGALTKMLRRVLQRGERLCILKSAMGLAAGPLHQISAGLRRYGPVDLFQVLPADQNNQAGKVGWTGPHILTGWIDAFAPAIDPGRSSPVWLSLCQTAHKLWQIRRMQRA